MSRSPTAYANTRRVAITLQLPADQADEIGNLARGLGTNRHAFLVMALNAGLPLMRAKLTIAAATASKGPPLRSGD